MYKIVTTAVIISLAVNFGVLALQNREMSHGDINRDGKVNVLDLSILSKNWTK